MRVKVSLYICQDSTKKNWILNLKIIIINSLISNTLHKLYIILLYKTRHESFANGNKETEENDKENRILMFLVFIYI